MGKYIGVGDGEGKTYPHPAPLSCLISHKHSMKMNKFDERLKIEEQNFQGEQFTNFFKNWNKIIIRVL